MRAELLQKATMVAETVRLQRVAALGGLATGAETPVYRRIKNQFLVTREAMPEWEIGRMRGDGRKTAVSAPPLGLGGQVGA